MNWFSFAVTALQAWSVWLLLLAYRVVGKPPGQDPEYDAALKYWSREFKLGGVLGLLTLALEVLQVIMRSVHKSQAN